MICQIYDTVPFYILSFYYFNNVFHISSVQFSCSVMSDFLWFTWTAARQASLSIILELAQTHVHQVGDAIQPSHTLSSSPPPAFNLFQHQDLFQGVSSSHQMAKVIGVSASASVLPMDSQDLFPLGWTGWISLQSKGLSRAFSNTTVQKHQFFDFHILSININ